MAWILLIEDNPVTAEMVKVRLAHAGHDVIHVTNGREALEQLRGPRPDLILLEMMVPEIDGAQILQHLKSDALLSSIPVLVVSARSHEDDILAALAAGADDYLTKPISLRELLARVDRVLSQGPEPLRVAVQGEKGPATVGEVVAADAGRASVRFHRDGAPRFAIGDPAKLSLSSPSLPETIELAATAESRGEGEPHRTYGFRLQREGQVAEEMIRSFLNLIGRRGAFRVSFDEQQEVPVLVFAQALGESHELMGALLDISTGGARLRLKATAERLLYLVDSFEMRFCLPDSVDIRHRAACREGVAYGVRFDADRSPEFLEQLEEISAFVLQRME
jgi:CheY-like chemotaxis protein